MAISYGDARQVADALQTLAEYLDLTVTQAASQLILYDEDREKKLREAINKYNEWLDLPVRERIRVTARELGIEATIEGLPT